MQYEYQLLAWIVIWIAIGLILETILWYGVDKKEQDMHFCAVLLMAIAIVVFWPAFLIWAIIKANKL